MESKAASSRRTPKKSKGKRKGKAAMTRRTPKKGEGKAASSRRTPKKILKKTRARPAYRQAGMPCPYGMLRSRFHMAGERQKSAKNCARGQQVET